MSNGSLPLFRTLEIEDLTDAETKSTRRLPDRGGDRLC